MRSIIQSVIVSLWFLPVMGPPEVCCGDPRVEPRATRRFTAQICFSPYDDPADHFDLASHFVLPEFDLKAVVLNLDDPQKPNPNRCSRRPLCRRDGHLIACRLRRESENLRARTLKTNQTSDNNRMGRPSSKTGVIGGRSVHPT